MRLDQTSSINTKDTDTTGIYMCVGVRRSLFAAHVANGLPFK